MSWKRTGDDLSDRVTRLGGDLTDRLEKLNKQGMQRSADLLDRLAMVLERLEKSQTEISRDVRRRIAPPPRRRPGRALGLLVLAGAAGYALAYLFDPEQGRSRRARLRDQFGSGARQLGTAAQQQTSYTTQAVKGYSDKLRRSGPDNPNPDDNTLVDRVESELFADPSVPKGRINIGAIDGKVILRGELDDSTQIGHIESAVRKIVGVKDVENLMHPAGVPAANKVAARRATTGGNGSAVE